MEYIIEFSPLTQDVKASAYEHFSETDILESSGFSGTEIITMLVSTGVVVLGKFLKFFNKNREHMKSATVKIGKKQVELSGYSSQEISDILANDQVGKIIEQLQQHD